MDALWRGQVGKLLGNSVAFPHASHSEAAWFNEIGEIFGRH